MTNAKIEPQIGDQETDVNLVFREALEVLHGDPGLVPLIGPQNILELLPTLWSDDPYKDSSLLSEFRAERNEFFRALGLSEQGRIIGKSSVNHRFADEVEKRYPGARRVDYQKFGVGAVYHEEEISDKPEAIDSYYPRGYARPFFAAKYFYEALTRLAYSWHLGTRVEAIEGAERYLAKAETLVGEQKQIVDLRSYINRLELYAERKIRADHAAPDTRAMDKFLSLIVPLYFIHVAVVGGVAAYGINERWMSDFPETGVGWIFYIAAVLIMYAIWLVISTFLLPIMVLMGAVSFFIMSDSWSFFRYHFVHTIVFLSLFWVVCLLITGREAN